ncbi:MAG: GPW/gp25 family protein [Bacteroidota bacterium]|nr:GPW/gp25 family protein [Bacteroidota bacterium]
MAERSDSFIGRGWSFAPSFDIPSASVVMAEGVDDIRQSLEILLTTTPGERIMQPKYGCHLGELLFESLDAGMKTRIVDRIKTAILYFEPRIEVTHIELDDARQNEGVVLVEIEYVVSATNSRFNFVYPFYRNEGTELDLLTTNHPLAK